MNRTKVRGATKRGGAARAARLSAGVSFVVSAALTAPAQAQQAGWGSVGEAQEETAWSFTDAIAPGFWMAWTNATAAFFVFVFLCIALMGFLEWRRPGGAPRDGVLGLATTRGDRLFISLLGSGFIFLGWLGLVGTPLWGPLALAALWAGFVFWKV